jgi:hypothetical protein
MPLDVVREDEQKQNRKATREFLEEAHGNDEESTSRGPDAEDVARFEAVTGAIRSIFAETPELVIPEGLTQEEQHALECLYAAKTSRDPEQGHFRSAVFRGAWLNQALAAFQPILALGLEPEFLEGRAAYDELKANVTALRHEISQRFLLEGGAGKAQKKDKGKADKKDDTTPPEDEETAEAETDSETESDSDSETESETATETEAEAEAGKKGGLRGWARRLVKGDRDE